MATYTAQILAGFRDPDCDGINPTHVLFLSENSRSAWCLYPIFKPGKPFFEKIWVCDSSTLLEDAMLMIGLFVLQNKELISLAERYDEKLISESFVEFLYPYEKKEGFYKKLKTISWNYLKVNLSLYLGSSLKEVLKLKEYKDLQFEIAVSLYLKNFSPFSRKFQFLDRTANLGDLKMHLDFLTRKNLEYIKKF